MLKFFGRGSAFTKSHNSAYFYADDALILIDCPMSSFHVLLEKGIAQKQIYVLVTHTHGDHVGGIPMLIHCARYMADAHVTVIAPTAEVAADLKYLIDRLEGCDPAAYTILTADQLDRKWFIGTVPVHHAPSLGVLGGCKRVVQVGCNRDSCVASADDTRHRVPRERMPGEDDGLRGRRLCEHASRRRIARCAKHPEQGYR